MLSKPDQAAANVEQARALRAAGQPYREIGRRLGLSSAQLGHVRRTLKREKAARTRLRNAAPQAGDADLPVAQAALPKGLRRILTQAGYRTLGDIAARLAETDDRVLERMPGIGAHRARLVTRLLDQFDLLPGPSDLQAAVEQLFPEFSDAPAPPPQAATRCGRNNLPRSTT
ncbi:hypothetical protein ACFOKI_08270 [Sphingomonas qilianensis]|uniref:RNA polymerase alpha subunit C-terminal domain-containing protein n=1 Tax=Sphingomonas qilianensis TaxID=1736690 RepID=A0ABU9XTK8_9SPHN